MRLTLLLPVLCALLGGCDPPRDLQVARTEEGLPVVTWTTAAAMGLYVVAPEAKLPGGPGEKVTEGQAYWVLEATTFPTGFGGPVTYRQVPEGARDATEKHGGVAGGEPLEKGRRYKFAVVSLGGQLAVEEEW